MAFLRTATAAALVAATLSAQSGSWGFLKDSYDKNADGKISKDEYPRGERAFANLDKNRDGAITADDFGRSRGGGRAGGPRAGTEAAAMQRLTRFVDLYGSFLNRDGKAGIDAAEWKRIAESFDIADGVIARDSVTKLLGKSGQGRMARMAGNALRGFDLDRNREVTVQEWQAAFAKLDKNGDGNLSQGDEVDLPPGVGELAPDFTLPHAKDSKKTVTLSSYRGDRPVALIFGSYT